MDSSEDSLEQETYDFQELDETLLVLREDLSKWLNRILEYELDTITPDNFMTSLDNGASLCSLSIFIHEAAVKHCSTEPINNSLKSLFRPNSDEYAITPRLRDSSSYDARMSYRRTSDISGVNNRMFSRRISEIVQGEPGSLHRQSTVSSGSNESLDTADYRAGSPEVLSWSETRPIKKYRIHAASGSWFARDNIAMFLNWCRKRGIRDEVLFVTQGLVSHSQEKNVILTLLELARLAANYGLPMPDVVRLEREIDRKWQRIRNRKNNVDNNNEIPASNTENDGYSSDDWDSSSLDLEFGTAISNQFNNIPLTKVNTNNNKIDNNNTYSVYCNLNSTLSQTMEAVTSSEDSMDHTVEHFENDQHDASHVHSSDVQLNELHTPKHLTVTNIAEANSKDSVDTIIDTSQSLDQNNGDENVSHSLDQKDNSGQIAQETLTQPKEQEPVKPVKVITDQSIVYEESLETKDGILNNDNKNKENKQEESIITNHKSIANVATDIDDTNVASGSNNASDTDVINIDAHFDDNNDAISVAGTNDAVDTDGVNDATDIENFNNSADIDDTRNDTQINDINNAINIDKTNNHNFATSNTDDINHFLEVDVTNDADIVADNQDNNEELEYLQIENNFDNNENLEAADPNNIQLSDENNNSIVITNDINNDISQNDENSDNFENERNNFNTENINDCISEHDTSDSRDLEKDSLAETDTTNNLNETKNTLTQSQHSELEEDSIEVEEKLKSNIIVKSPHSDLDGEEDSIEVAEKLKKSALVKSIYSETQSENVMDQDSLDDVLDDGTISNASTDMESVVDLRDTQQSKTNDNTNCSDMDYVDDEDDECINAMMEEMLANGRDMDVFDFDDFTNDTNKKTSAAHDIPVVETIENPLVPVIPIIQTEGTVGENISDKNNRTKSLGDSEADAEVENIFAQGDNTEKQIFSDLSTKIEETHNLAKKTAKQKGVSTSKRRKTKPLKDWSKVVKALSEEEYVPTPEDLEVDRQVTELTSTCTCDPPFSVTKLRGCTYRLGGRVCFLRLLRGYVMVRVGGGWSTLHDYLRRHDPCRVFRFQGTGTQGYLLMKSRYKSKVSDVTL